MTALTAPAKSSLNGPQLKFCEGVAKGLNQTEAYCAAYPQSGREAARRSASELLTNPDVVAEINAIRAKAEEKAGSAVLTLAEKRAFLARVVRARVSELPNDSDLWDSIEHTKTGVKYTLPKKLAALLADNELGGKATSMRLTITAQVDPDPTPTMDAEFEELPSLEQQPE